MTTTNIMMILMLLALRKSPSRNSSEESCLGVKRICMFLSTTSIESDTAIKKNVAKYDNVRAFTTFIRGIPMFCQKMFDGCGALEISKSCRMLFELLRWSLRDFSFMSDVLRPMWFDNTSLAIARVSKVIKLIPV